ncbi:hypothetical protein B9Z19DRAFT_976845, partial [Tuber borchii]
SDLDKRDNCIYNCECDKNVSPGLYCGYCLAVTSCKFGQPCYNDVFQCGHGGNCCTFGVRKPCQNRQGPGC